MIETNNELDQLLDQPLLDYLTIYGERHNLNPAKVAANPAFDLAALLEFQVGTGTLTLEEARYQFVEQYPESNCLYIYSKSVLKMILPYDDMPRALLRHSLSPKRLPTRFKSTRLMRDDGTIYEGKTEVNNGREKRAITIR